MSKVYKGEILGELQLKNNNCTDTISVHPVRSGNWFLIPPDLDKVQQGHQYDFTSLIGFDGRQTWDVYYCNEGSWIVQNEKKNLYLRMPTKDFERFFGKYKILPKDTKERTNR